MDGDIGGKSCEDVFGNRVQTADNLGRNGENGMAFLFSSGVRSAIVRARRVIHRSKEGRSPPSANGVPQFHYPGQEFPRS